MKRLGTFFLLAPLLFAAPYPALYSAVGDAVYGAMDGFDAMLKEGIVEADGPFADFTAAATALQQRGLALDLRSSADERRDYITELRELEERLPLLIEMRDMQLKRLLNAGAYEQIADLNSSLLADHPAVKRAELALQMQSGQLEVKELDARSRLYVSLEQLKRRLGEARAIKSPKARCLNDITGMNYWMLAAEEANATAAACKGLRACDQLDAFAEAARKSCGEEQALFELWREQATPYRYEMKRRFQEGCR